MKKLVSLLLVLTMVLALAACGSKTETPSTTAAATTAAPAATEAPAADGEKVTVTMLTAQYGKQTAQWWADFAAKFNAEHDNIEVVVDCVSWNDIYTVVNTRVANGEAPDLLNIDVFADYQADGLLLPAKDWVSEETYAKFYPSFLEQSVVDGTVWAVPDLASARALYYNKDILEAAGVEVPTTWDELDAACAKLKDAGITPITADDAYMTSFIGYHLARLVGEDKVKEIAEMKMPDLNAASIEAAMSMIAGTARSMGIVVED